MCMCKRNVAYNLNAFLRIIQLLAQVLLSFCHRILGIHIQDANNFMYLLKKVTKITDDILNIYNSIFKNIMKRKACGKANLTIYIHPSPTLSSSSSSNRGVFFTSLLFVFFKLLAIRQMSLLQFHIVNFLSKQSTTNTIYYIKWYG